MRKELSQQNSAELWGIYEATHYLELVELKLEERDDAQEIFESLNSKGLSLFLWDKVRNLVLMSLPQDDDHYYDNYWQPIEDYVLSWNRVAFIRFYLEAKQGHLPRRELYFEFKRFRATCGMSATELLKDMRRYAEVFSWIDWRDFPLEQDQALKEKIKHSLLRLQCMHHTTAQHVWIPFGMQCMLRYQAGELTAAQILEVLRLVETFITRRWLYGDARNGPESFFVSLDRELSDLNEPKAGTDFVSKLKWLLCAPNAQLPHDEELKTPFQYRNFNYVRAPHNTMRNFILACFEEEYARTAKAEQVNLFESLLSGSKNFTCEHIMPQTMTDAWKAELGPNAEELHGQWVHRFANLTLTAFNSEYSNKSFQDKCNMEHGYAHSPLFSNRAIAQHEHWDEAALKQRTEELYQMALKIWPYPTIATDA